MLPGLNLHPARLHPLRDFLLVQGLGAAYPALSGFPEPCDEDQTAPAVFLPGVSHAWGSLSAGDWLADLDDCVRQLRAQLPHAAISLLGHSMGALLGLVWSLERGQPIKRAVLLSPALRLRWHIAPSLHALRALLPRRMRLPSLGPAEYLAHQGTSLAAYGALLDLLAAFANYPAGAASCGEAVIPCNGQQAMPPPPLQFLAYARDDKLISTSYLRHYATCMGDRITTHTLAHAPAAGASRHLGIDAHTLGDSEWAALLAALQAWLAR